MIYRGPGFLAVVQFGFSPISKVDRRQTGRLRKRDYSLMGEGVGGRGGAKSYHDKSEITSFYIGTPDKRLPNRMVLVKSGRETSSVQPIQVDLRLS
jgi:hypothetical protein